MADKALSELIREFRKQTLTKEGKPYSLMDLSLEIGWSNPSTLSRIENGDVIPSRDTVIKIGKALRLKTSDLNLLLRTCGYKDYNPELTDAYIREFVDSMRNGYDGLAYPVVLLDANTRKVYWNRFTEVFFIGADSVHEEVVAGFENLTHIDSLFNPIYGIRQNIMNWDELSKILVENIYFHISHLTDQRMDSAYLEKWMEYEDFRKHWIVCEETKGEDYTSCNIPFVYRNKELGVIGMIMNLTLTERDNRFFLEQFAPATPQDAEKLRRYWNKVQKKGR